MIFIRRIVGGSMMPGAEPGCLIIAVRRRRLAKAGQVVIIRHNGIEKIKRVAQVKDGRLFVLGDNLLASTDSRHFGWVDGSVVVARVVWPR